MTLITRSMQRFSFLLLFILQHRHPALPPNHRCKLLGYQLGLIALGASQSGEVETCNLWDCSVSLLRMHFVVFRAGRLGKETVVLSCPESCNSSAVNR